jgi:flagella basal body P-ring formation protein FlgA
MIRIRRHFDYLINAGIYVLFDGLTPMPAVSISTDMMTAFAMQTLFLYSLAALLLVPEMARAQATPRQDVATIRQVAEQFLKAQSAGLPGKTSIEVGQVDPRLNLPSCLAPSAFLPQGSRAWGKTTVGVRCAAPTAWTVYVQATVRVTGSYIAAAVPLAQGQLVQASDVALVEGDLTTLPAGIVTDPAQAIGRTSLQSVAVGAPLRQDLLRGQNAVQQGQTVRLVSSGPGFRVSLEGRALSSALEGETVRAKTPAGQVVTGIARAGGVMEVLY